MKIQCWRNVNLTKLWKTKVILQTRTRCRINLPIRKSPKSLWSETPAARNGEGEHETRTDSEITGCVIETLSLRSSGNKTDSRKKMPAEYSSEQKNFGCLFKSILEPILHPKRLHLPIGARAKLQLKSTLAQEQGRRPPSPIFVHHSKFLLSLQSYLLSSTRLSIAFGY